MSIKRIKFIFIILTSIFVSIHVSGQNANNWISHISYGADISSIAQEGDNIYALTDGKLFIYNQSDQSIEEYIKEEGGNTDIIHITYNKKHKCLFITRSDATIELLYEDRSYTSIFDLKNYSAQNIDKQINSVYMTEDFAYLATNYGFSKVDISDVVIRESGIFNKKFYSISSFSGNLYAATEDGVRTININSNANDQDWEDWTTVPLSQYYTDNEYKFEDSDLRTVVLFDDKLHFLLPNSAVYILESDQSVRSILKGGAPQKMYLANSGRLMIVNQNKFWEYTNLNTQKSLDINGLVYIIPNQTNQSEYWISQSGYNLSLGTIEDSSINFNYQWIAPEGPVSNYPFSQSIQNGQLIVTGGGYYTTPFGYPASMSILDNSRWRNIYTNNIPATDKGDYVKDFGYAIASPSDSKRIFASSWGDGLYEFYDGEFVNKYDTKNSSLQEIYIPATPTQQEYRTTRIGGMAYDRNGNLWVLNSQVDNTIHVLQKNGEWIKSQDLPLISGVTYDTNTKTIFIDRYSNKWIGTFEGSNYLAVTNSKSINMLRRGEFFERNGANLDIIEINDITEDNDGNIWIATDLGPYRIFNSSNIASSDPFRLNRVRVDRESGTGGVTGLLEDAYINAIRVDGANRKWIGTQRSGVYLLSADNREILEHFTLEDSPLPSNNIISIEIDPNNGTVYLGTDRGLMAYRSRITQGANDFSNVYVYPNPVRPDYSGVITVTGLETDTNIKITDVKGNLIIEGKSLGGQFVWNGLTAKGKKAESGVYLVFGSSQDGQESVVTKIMIVR